MINADMTVYNKVFNKATRLDEYVSYQIKEVSWNSKNTVNIDKGLESANSVSIFIFDEEKYNLNEGDIIVKGLIDDVITTQKELEQKYKDVFNITSIDYVSLGSEKMHHYEIGGK